MTPPGDTIFEEHAGHFWGIHETRPYMRARFAVVEAQLKIKTHAAAKAALDHILEMLRLCRSDNMGVRDVAPPIFLRLGQDQECYDFVKWWATTGVESNYDWGDMDAPYLHLKGEDPFEPVDLFKGKWTALSHTASVMLVKIRILRDLKALDDSDVVGEIVPQEILDNIRGQLVSTIVAGNKDIMNSKDQKPLIEKLEQQVKELYESLHEANPYFWDALLEPGRHLTARPEAYSHGSREQMAINLQYSYNSWVETPGAIDMIREMHKNHSKLIFCGPTR
jgi:hypothetical protein